MFERRDRDEVDASPGDRGRGALVQHAEQLAGIVIARRRRPVDVSLRLMIVTGARSGVHERTGERIGDVRDAGLVTRSERAEHDEPDGSASREQPARETRRT